MENGITIMTTNSDDIKSPESYNTIPIKTTGDTVIENNELNNQLVTKGVDGEMSSI